MSKKKDYYEILGVPKNASIDEIKKAYKRTAIKYHPDKNPGDKTAEGKFKEAAEAYEILSDSNKRARYDQFGHAANDMGGGGGGGYYGGAGGMNMEDIFRNFGDIFGEEGNPFESFFGGGGRNYKRGRGTRGSNLRVKLKLSLEEIATGTEKKIKLKKYVSCGTCSGSGAKSGSKAHNCSTCNGQGYVRKVQQTILGSMQTTTTCPSCQGQGSVIADKCASCKGEGRVYGEENIEINVPAGVAEGMEMQVGGKGNAGQQGGGNGDLIVGFEEMEHPHFIRQQDNILYNLTINYADAVLGTNVEVPTLSGKVKLKIPHGTQPGKVLRLKDKGLRRVNTHHTGDQLIQVNVFVPKSLTSEDEKILEKMKYSKTFEPKQTDDKKGFFDKMRDMFDGI